MRRVTAVPLAVLFSVSAIAALAPEYQNEKDFGVMVEFVRSHERVIATLKSIDFEKRIVYFGDDCEAIFDREFTLRPPGWVGPAASLELKSSTCRLD